MLQAPRQGPQIGSKYVSSRGSRSSCSLLGCVLSGRTGDREPVLGHPIQHPGAALAVVCPTIAALVLVRHHNSADLANWTLRLPTWSWWWILAVVAVPAVVRFTSLLAVDLPPAAPTLSSLAVLVLIFIVGAVLEEIGWTGFALHGSYDLPRLCSVADQRVLDRYGPGRLDPHQPTST